MHVHEKKKIRVSTLSNKYWDSFWNNICYSTSIAIDDIILHGETGSFKFKNKNKTHLMNFLRLNREPVNSKYVTCMNVCFNKCYELQHKQALYKSSFHWVLSHWFIAQWLLRSTILTARIRWSPSLRGIEPRALSSVFRPSDLTCVLSFITFNNSQKHCSL